MTQMLPDSCRADASAHEELFPIREVSRLTGVNPVTLRAWERRYGLIVPTRTESGHRLYSQTDIDNIRTITQWIERGVAVSKVGKILASLGGPETRRRALHSVIDATEQERWQADVRAAVNDFDENRLDQLYGQIFSMYPLPVVFEELLMPVWHDFAARHDAFGQISEWLMLDSFLRARTLQRAQLARGSAGQRVLLVAMPDACRELELWVAGILMSSPEIPVTVLAPGQPLDELSLVCSKMRPQAVVLYSNQVPASDLAKKLTRLSLSLNCPLLLAGEIADMAADSLDGSAIGCLGSSGQVMQRRLQLFLAGRLDT